jgi:hypothetical protein
MRKFGARVKLHPALRRFTPTRNAIHWIPGLADRPMNE